MLALGLVLAFGLFGVGIPICVAFGLGGSLALTAEYGLPISTVGSMLYDQLAHFSWVAAPLFILAGNFMVQSKSAQALMDLMEALLGHVPGGMAVAAVVACTFFAAISGSGTATIASIGTIMIPRMVQMGYQKGFAAGIISVAGTLGNLIPPSIFFIIYGMLVERSIAELFAAGFLPGILSGLMLAVVAMWTCRGSKALKVQRVSRNQLLHAFMHALPALSIPVVILGGIYGGVFTPTEAGAVGCVVAVLAGYWYKGMTWLAYKKACADSLRVNSMLMFLIGTAILLAKVLVLSGFPQVVTNLVTSMNLGPITYLLVVVVVLLLFGTFMEGTPMLYVTLPIVLPSALILGVSPIHLGVIYCMAILVGQITPPVGIMLYVGSSISGAPPNEVIKGSLPFLLTMAMALIVVTVFPSISLILPELINR